MTSQDKTPIRALIEAVEDGNANSDAFYAYLESPYYDMADRAYNGSLDAALALHETLLPGWVFCVTEDSAMVMMDWSNPGYGNTPPIQAGGYIAGLPRLPPSHPPRIRGTAMTTGERENRIKALDIAIKLLSASRCSIGEWPSATVLRRMKMELEDMK